MKIEMTGKEDRLDPWKYAVGGFPGSGKTLLASTAPNPLFVFFRENPRIKSIADRYVAHVKVLNDERTTVLDKMQVLIAHLAIETDYETLVIDTGDELQVAMKEARRIHNGGEFGVADWGWLGDAYRELLGSLLDLPMRVIVLFHVKTSQDTDEGSFRELLLQGSVKDEAAGWFDIVGALDTFEVANDEGNIETRRVLLTHSSRLYPWLKDHSGNMPVRYELTSGFVGDIRAIEEVLNSTEITTERTVIGELGDEKTRREMDPGEVIVGSGTVVTPAQLEAAKSADTPEINKAIDTVAAEMGIAEISDPVDPSDEDSTASELSSESAKPEPEIEQPKLPEAEVSEPVVSEPISPVVSEPASDEVPEPEVCEVCGKEAPADVITVSKIRFKKVLCREHFREKLKAD